MSGARIPAATYRLQFSPRFRLADAAALVPYLHALGVTDIYASPLLQARRGSEHGYDVTRPDRLNPELGGKEAFDSLAAALRRHDMGLLLDVVPNHMAADSDNPWWKDVLQNGPDSPYADYFDIDWQPPRPGLAGKVMVPVLGSPYGEALENGEIQLVRAEDGYAVRYHDKSFPLNPRSGPASRQLAGDVPHAGLHDVDLLDQLLQEQAYRLVFWRVAHQEINYRRFFNISELVALRAEDERVFHATHGLVLQLVAEGKVTGLRIDHVDGLFDPQGYLDRLQESLAEKGGPGFYVLVEKILSGDEELPVDWPVYGTTGYDFLKTVNELFVDRRGIEVLDKIYARLHGSEADFAKVVYARKRRVMADLFGGEVRALVRQLGRLAEQDRFGHDLTLRQLEETLVEVTACFPVYRTYIRGFAVADRDRAYIERAVAAAAKRHRATGPALEFLRRVLLLEFQQYHTAEQRRAWLRFVMRWQQFTGPIMAKGLEDTALYVYNRLVSLNEVGGEPHTTGIPVEEFHRFNSARQERWPHAMNTTSTHDTKRSEDVRMRINVLSEIPALWAEHLECWRKWNWPAKPVVNGQPVPDGNTELLIYQTLVGTWPFNPDEIPSFKERLRGYLVKSAREAKVYTKWSKPDTDYEEALVNFVMTVLEPGGENPFLADFLQLQKITAYYGALNSLAQVLLKVTAPGVPDFYQGMELWNFSLVDPDNRRPVDYETRRRMLAALQEREKGDRLGLVRELLQTWMDGRVKLYLTYKALHCRRNMRRLFASGRYLPVQVTGPRRENACALARHMENTWVLAAVPRLLARLQVRDGGALPGTKLLPDAALWEGTCLLLPAGTPRCWHNVLTGEEVRAAPGGEGEHCLPLGAVWGSFPVALLQAKE